ncbi:MAG: SAM-dependent chlorinase/fluorinase [Proteobacteria bacterium]|nr:SAM-dependent chlorinase/fluorinase [Pseudomonadota bacterium]
MAATIVLLTDFGLSDPYVAQMKGAILSRHPDATLVDLSHDIPPFELPRAALFLEASRRHFPRGTIFVAVIDPGVGTARRIVALEKDGQTFLAPDNGLLGLVLAAPGEARSWDLSAHARGDAVSATFHGRDVFAPLAAALGAGEPAADLGPEIEPAGLTRPPWAEPVPTKNPVGVEVSILHVDHFGNCLTNLPLEPWARRLPSAAQLIMTPSLGASRAVLRVQTYAQLERAQLGLIPGSQGYLELALNQASAASETGLAPGDTLILSTKEAELR